MKNEDRQKIGKNWQKPNFENSSFTNNDDKNIHLKKELSSEFDFDNVEDFLNKNSVNIKLGKVQNPSLEKKLSKSNGQFEKDMANNFREKLEHPEVEQSHDKEVFEHGLDSDLKVQDKFNVSESNLRSKADVAQCLENNDETNFKTTEESKKIGIFKILNNTLTFVFLIGVFILSTITFGTMYAYPQGSFWDENYHISSGQKYLEGEYFMELHPPLGKLLIGAGEKLFNPNEGVRKVYYDEDTKTCKKFTQTDYIKNFPTKTEKCQYIYLDKTTNSCVDYVEWKKLNGVALGTQNSTSNNAQNTSQNSNTSQTQTEPTPNADCQARVKEMSFAGYRFFPVVFAILTGPMFFLAILIFTRNNYVAAIFSLLYIFDNALVVHFRGAMLEGVQMFFVVSAIAYFAYLWMEKTKVRAYEYALLGVISGLVLATKVNGLIVILLVLPLILRDIYPYFKQKKYLKVLFKFLKTSFIYLLTLLITFASIYLIHTSLGKNRSTDKYYVLEQYTNERDVKDGVACGAGEWEKSGILNCRFQKMKAIVDAGKQANILNFPRVLMENIAFNGYYSNGVPALDITKPGENGSSPWTWPQGNKAISYRWSSGNFPLNQYENKDLKAFCQSEGWKNEAICKNNFESFANACDKGFEGKERFCERRVSYLYLQSNPVAWSISLIGVLLAFAWVIAVVFFGLEVKNHKLFGSVSTLLSMYGGYMFAVSQIKRVMYLYHYFIPLVLGMLLASLMFFMIYEDMLKNKKDARYVYLILFIIGVLVIYAYWFFSPLTYYVPINETDFNERIWNRDWQLKYAK